MSPVGKGSRGGSPAAGVLLCLLLVGWGMVLDPGCTSRKSDLREPDAGERPAGDAFFAEVLNAAGLGDWRSSYGAQTGEGLEGLTQLVDGAAEELWSQGVRGAVFQEFAREGGTEALEFQLYFFVGAEPAAGYLEAGCRESRAVECPGYGCAKACALVGEHVSQALVGMGSEVLEIRVYAGREAAEPLLDRLIRASARAGCR